MKSNYTIGVEEEYQLVDRETGELKSRAEDVLNADWSEEIKGELQKTMLEIGTTVCEDAAGVEKELRRLRFQVGTAAATAGLDIVAAGIHPFSHWSAHQPMEGERPRMIIERFGRSGRDEHLFGMHVHVGLPDDADRISIMNRVRPFLPHILALSCSSPFFEGEDAGHDSFRTILWKRLPLSGAPPHFDSEDEYNRFVELLLSSGAVPDRRTLYWGVRLSWRYPTIEIRSPDVCPRIEDAAAIGAFARMIVVAAAEGLLLEPSTSDFNPALIDACVDTNRWLAARYGLDANLIDPTGPDGANSVADSVRELVSRFGHLSEELGDGDALRRLGTIIERGNGADRMRRFHSECGDMRDLVEWLVGETSLGTGLDRRSEQRTPQEITS